MGIRPLPGGATISGVGLPDLQNLRRGIRRYRRNHVIADGNRGDALAHRLDDAAALVPRMQGTRPPDLAGSVYASVWHTVATMRIRTSPAGWGYVHFRSAEAGWGRRQRRDLMVMDITLDVIGKQKL